MNDFLMLDLAYFIYNGSLYFFCVYICSVIMLSIFIFILHEALCTVWCDMRAINESRKETSTLSASCCKTKLGVTVISGQVIGGFLFYMEWMEHQF